MESDFFFPFFTKWNEITTTQILCKSSAHNFLQLPKIPADDLSVSENIAEVGFSISVNPGSYKNKTVHTGSNEKQEPLHVFQMIICPWDKGVGGVEPYEEKNWNQTPIGRLLTRNASLVLSTFVLASFFLTCWVKVTNV